MVKRIRGVRLIIVGLSLSALVFAFAVPARADDNPYPTITIADYVFACMASNGDTRAALEKCSCSIDVIASIISYEAYEKAETVLSMRRIAGERSSLFKISARWRKAVDNLKRAQAEAEVRCF